MSYNIFIVGLGLIGGSLGLALQGSSLVNNITGYDIDKVSLLKAQQMGAINKMVKLKEGVRDADLIILCTPLRYFPSILSTIRSELKPGTIITDVGSTKQHIMRMYKSLLPEGVWGIGGHPMAGSELGGINGADRYLFENAIYVLTPARNTPLSVTEGLLKLLTTTGARMKVMGAARHDELVATVSHIPHITAVSLVNLTSGDDDNLMLAAGGFRDTTRIASSGANIWEDILFSNRNQLVPKLNELITELKNLKSALITLDKDYIQNKLEQAKIIRDKIPAIRKGLLPGFCDIICIVPDSPGVIGKIGAWLGEYDINIVDIEILRAREGDGGTMRVGVPSEEDAHKAVQILNSKNIKAWVR